MTLIVALRGIDGLVMAADSRGTVGDPRGLTAINDTYVKLFQLTQHVGVAIAGSSELAAQLISEVRLHLNTHPDSQFIDEVMLATRQVLKSKYADWFGSVLPEARPHVIFMLAGYTANAEPKIYLLVSQIDFAPQLFNNGHSLAGVPQYAVYLLHRLYRPDMNRSNLLSLAAYVISETATQDPKVGGPIRMAEIMETDGYREVDQTIIQELVERNEEQNRRLRDFFFGR